MRTLTAALLAALLLASVACASSSASTGSSAVVTPTTTGVTTKADYLVAGNAICKRMTDEQSAIARSYPGGKPTTPFQLTDALNKSADLVTSTLTQLRALPQPTGDAATLSALYTDVAGLAGLLSQMAVAVANEDSAARSSLSTQGDTLQAKANAEANAYGLTECGKSS